MIRQFPTYSISLIQQYSPNTVAGKCTEVTRSTFLTPRGAQSGDAGLCPSPTERLAMGQRSRLALEDHKGWGGENLPKERH